MRTNIPHRVDLKPGNTINGKYTVKSTLGEGAFGSVYKVVDAGGGGRRSDPNAPRKGDDLQFRMNITFEEAVFGKETEIKFLEKLGT